ncbi:MAG TPA: ABC transporter permease [Ornithinibacter sp.]|nr:ABC transporter permease [Ornithinibacter sp.]HQD69091.1 ABC transporter permease [Ornithinibacter sp.]
MSAIATTLTKNRASLGKAILSSPIIGPLAALLLACIFFAVMTPNFMTGPNFSLIMQQVMVVGVLAIGQTLVILTAGIDLSNGAVMALSGVLMASLAAQHHLNPVLAILLGIGIAVIFGAVNGGLLTGINLPPFIVTLGTYSIAYALTRIYTTATIDKLPKELTALGSTFNIGGTEITFGTLLMLLLYVITWFALKYTKAGRSVFAVGDNPEAARLAGIKTNRVLIGVYTVAAFTYGIAALLLVSRTGVGDPNAGATANMDSITAVVVGGTSMFGGRGSIVGTFIGALIVGVFRNGLQLMGVPAIYQVLITGVLVIAAVSIDQLTHRNKR